MFSMYVISVLLASSCSWHSLATNELEALYEAVSAAYNRTHPVSYKQLPPPPEQHERRCSLLLPHQALGALSSGVYTRFVPEGVLVTSPCLGIDSLGNYLGNYFESMSCAHKLGVAFMAVAKIYEPRTRDSGNAFLDSLPHLVAPVAQQQPRSGAFNNLQLKKACPCGSLCHQRSDALWLKEGASLVVRPVLLAALERARAASTTVNRGDLSTVPQNSVLPFAAEVTIHYRCGDNFVDPYGFLPFKALERAVLEVVPPPSQPKSIYVLSEARGRKTSSPAKQHLAAKCDAVLRALYDFLSSRFPASTVLLRRGGDPYEDLARLAFSQVTICSVSTFCLWPTWASNNTALFPLTSLVAGANASVVVRPGFRWLAAPIVRGRQFASSQGAVALLSALGAPPKTILNQSNLSNST